MLEFLSCLFFGKRARRQELASALLGFGVPLCVALLFRLALWAASVRLVPVALLLGCVATLSLGLLGVACIEFPGIGLRAAGLGVAFGASAVLALSAHRAYGFGIYGCVLTFFHWSEFMATGLWSPRNLKLSSFLIDHSSSYSAAAVASWLEFWLQAYFFPQWKSVWWLQCAGVATCVLGEGLRKAAMWRAGSNFNHVVQTEKERTHRLVTGGVYALSRHPAYCGWFWWAIGTQVILANPFCVVAYAAAAWVFFQRRLEDEEEALIRFFGQDYLDYAKKVGTGIPFLKGCAVAAAIE